ncbi:hypothetical protein ABZW18_26210 [Streptomyces sp. NPDC004647]|uniref:hypothetical protein n=1 Tax=Streptomyces sp. NPDC004647 TaxID=3154671 RepID=UPI0033A10BFA
MSITNPNPSGRTPATTGSAHARAAFDRGVHPATGLDLLPAEGDNPPTCGSCLLTRTKSLTRTGDDGTTTVTEYLKCSRAATSRNKRRGIDLRRQFPACVLYNPGGDPAPAQD